MRAGTRVRLAAFVAGVVLVWSPEARAAALDGLKSAGLDLPTAAASSTSSARTPAARAGERAGKIAEAQHGKPYVFGADGPGSFDCSGLVRYAWNKAGASWPDTTANGLGTHWPAVRGKPRPGDLLVWDFGPGSRVAGYDHVAIVTAGGRFVEAPTPGVPVRIRSLAGAHASKIVRPSAHW